MSNLISGKVISVTAAGDLVTDIANDQIPAVSNNDTVSVKFGPHQTVGIHDLDHNEPESTLLAVRGSSGYLELTIVGVSLSDMLAIGPGESVEVSW